MNEVRQVNQIDCIDSYLKLIDLRSSVEVNFPLGFTQRGIDFNR